MEYGKLAYVKAQELEAYLKKSAAAEQKTGCASVAFYPHTAAESGYTPVTVFGSGNVGLTVTVTLRAGVAVRGAKLRLYAGEKLAAYSGVSLDEGKTERSTLLATVYPQEGEALKLIADTPGLLIEEMFVLAEGARVRLVSNAAGTRCDGSGNNAFAAFVHNGDVCVKKCGTTLEKTAFKGGVFDLAVLLGEVYLFGCDDNGNLLGITYDFDLAETSRTVLTQEAFSCVAIGHTAYGLLLAGLKGRKPYFCVAGERFMGRTDFSPADFATEADELYLSKQADTSALFIKRDDALYCKLPMPTLGARDCIRLTFGYLR